MDTLAFFALPFDEGSYIRRYIEAFGGSGRGYVQAACYAMSAYAFLELRNKIKKISIEQSAFELKLLPEQDFLVLPPDEISDIKLSIVDMEQRGIQYLLSGLIIRVCNQFRNNSSMSEAYTVLSSHVKTQKEKMEGNLSQVRYIIEAIPMLGFIGTVIGLIDAIIDSKDTLTVNLADKQEALSIVTDAFGMAFGSTLVALLLSVVLNHYYQSFLGKLDVFFSNSEQYIVENLISRVYGKQ